MSLATCGKMHNKQYILDPQLQKRTSCASLQYSNGGVCPRFPGRGECSELDTICIRILKAAIWPPEPGERACQSLQTIHISKGNGTIFVALC